MTKQNPLPIAYHQAVMRCLREKLQLANQQLASHYPEPKISYRLRGANAGKAYLLEWEIRLNPVLLIENQNAFIDQTVPHELAHLLVYQQFGKVAPHGKEWRWMMEHILNVPARRTHNFPVRSVQGVTFDYRCACQIHLLTLRRHQRVIRQLSQYRCRRCGEQLQHVPE